MIAFQNEGLKPAWFLLSPVSSALGHTQVRRNRIPVAIDQACTDKGCQKSVTRIVLGLVGLERKDAPHDSIMIGRCLSPLPLLRQKDERMARASDQMPRFGGRVFKGDMLSPSMSHSRTSQHTGDHLQPVTLECPRTIINKFREVRDYPCNLTFRCLTTMSIFSGIKTLLSGVIRMALATAISKAPHALQILTLPRQNESPAHMRRLTNAMTFSCAFTFLRIGR